MKRDLDYSRRILLDLESTRGAECPLSVLRAGLSPDADQRLRYHVQLLVDAGLVEEVDRTPHALGSVRLTSHGIDFIDLCRSDRLWRHATELVLERTGGLSFIILRMVLTRWAEEATTRGDGRALRHRYQAYVPQYSGHLHNDDPYGRLEFDDEPQALSTRPEYRKRTTRISRSRPADNPCDYESLGGRNGATLPIYLV